MKPEDVLEIEVSYSDLIAKIKQHLAVIGKRAKTVDGSSMFSDLTTSSQEDVIIWKDLCDGGAETVVSVLAQLSSYYVKDGSSIVFVIIGKRWHWYEDDYDLEDLQEALKNAIEKFIWNYAIKEYLSIIHPGTGAKYPPIWANPYEQRMQHQIKVIRDLAYIKRSPDITSEEYNDVTGVVIEEENNEEEERELGYENPFDFIEEHHHRSRKGRDVHQRGERQIHFGTSYPHIIQ